MKKIAHKFKNKKYIIVLSIIGLLLALKIALPPYILKKTNEYLANFSPNYYGHVEDMKISLLTVSADFENFDLRRKNAKNNFLEAEDVKVTLAWRKLFDRRILIDINAHEVKANLYKTVFQTPKKVEETKEEESSFTFKIDQLVIENSTLHYAQTANAPASQHLNFHDVNIYISNISPEHENSIMKFKATSNLPPKASLKLVGQARPFLTPMDWNMDIELKNFHLPSANGYLKTVPLSFNRGQLDLVSEVKSVKGSLEGYLKPFFKDVDIVGDKADFGSGKHLFVELFSAFGKFILKNPETNTIATKIYFNRESANSEMHVDTSTAINSAIDYKKEKNNIKPVINKEVKL